MEVLLGGQTAGLIFVVWSRLGGIGHFDLNLKMVVFEITHFVLVTGFYLGGLKQ